MGVGRQSWNVNKNWKFSCSCEWMKLQSLKEIRAPMRSQKQVQPATQKKMCTGLRPMAALEGSWTRKLVADSLQTRTPQTHHQPERKKETSRDQKLTRKNIDQDHQPVMHQTTIPATISTPENQSAGARKRAREGEREKRESTGMPSGRRRSCFKPNQGWLILIRQPLTTISNP
jgi:hypothetical protein